jgi:hypothetical protein
MHGVASHSRMRIDSLLWLEYADSTCYSKYKTLDKALHRERAAAANTAGAAGKGMLQPADLAPGLTRPQQLKAAHFMSLPLPSAFLEPGNTSHKPTAAATPVASWASLEKTSSFNNASSVMSASGLNHVVKMTQSSPVGRSLAAEVIARQLDTVAINSDLFLRQQDAVNAEGTQQPYYALPLSFYSSQYARDAAAGIGANRGQ